jgi:hypothetical protein
VNELDVEISTRLRATQLVMHVVPEAVLEAIGDGVSLTAREARSGLPKTPERCRRHTDIAIEKHVYARTALHDQQPRSGGVEHDG